MLMSEKELNSYRLTSLEEPTDEMLSQIMREIAEEVKAKNEAADNLLMDNLRKEGCRRSELRKAL